MTELERNNLDAALRFIRLVEQAAPAAAFDDLVDPRVVQTELPNLLFKQGVTRDHAAVVAGPARATVVLESQKYTVINAFAAGDWVTVESDWEGVTKIPLGKIPAGSRLSCHYATIFQFSAGRIVLMRQYDCYDPLPEPA